MCIFETFILVSEVIRTLTVFPIYGCSFVTNISANYKHNPIAFNVRRSGVAFLSYMEGAGRHEYLRIYGYEAARQEEYLINQDLCAIKVAYGATYKYYYAYYVYVWGPL